MTKFEAGKSYKYFFVTNSDIVVECKVLKRTAKTITIDDGREVRKGLRIKEDGDGEFVFPLGRFSMAPILRAKRAC